MSAAAAMFCNLRKVGLKALMGSMLDVSTQIDIDKLIQPSIHGLSLHLSVNRMLPFIYKGSPLIDTLSIKFHHLFYKDLYFA